MVFASTLALRHQAGPPVTGTWSGWLLVKHDGETEELHVHAVLKQAADALTGTAGPDADHQYPIRKGKVERKKDVTAIAFELLANGVHQAFTLELVDGLLKGRATVEGEDGKPLVATVELKPVK